MDYLIRIEKDKINEFHFKQNQMPNAWFYKSYRLHKDANILYYSFEKDRISIINKLKEEGFFKYNDSRELKRCMYDILEKNPEIDIPEFRSFYLLAGFSIENALKGIYISKNIHIINEKNLDKKLKEHNLKKLTNMIKLNLSNGELTFLEKLSVFTVSYGRYPVKVACSDCHSKRFNYDYGDINHYEACENCVTNPYEEDKNLFETIYKKLNILMNEANKNYADYMKTLYKIEIEDEF